MDKVSLRSRIVENAMMDPESLLAHPDNWRIHPRFQEAALEKVLDRVGWVQRVIVNQQTGHVVDGHLRVALALKRNEPEIPVTVVDLSEDEERVMLAALDPIGMMAERDYAKARELSALVGAQESGGELARLFESELDTDVARKALFADQLLSDEEQRAPSIAGQAAPESHAKQVTLYYGVSELQDFQRLVVARRHAGAASVEAAVLDALRELEQA